VKAVLLAKRAPAQADLKGAKSLLAHSVDVLDAVEALFGTRDQPSLLGIAWLRFFRIAPERWPEFHANLVAAALLHDIGKANEGFQATMQGQRDAQLMRHEHFSALLLAWQPMTDWLAANPLLRPDHIISAVACHHLKADLQPPRFAGYPGFAGRYAGADRNVLRICEPDSLSDLLCLAAEHLGLSEPPAPAVTWSFDGTKGESIHAAADAIRRRLVRIEAPRRGIWDKHAPPRDLMLPALKAALLAADAAGSGLPRTDHDIKGWIADAFPNEPLRRDDIEQCVLARRVEQIQTERRKREPGYAFEYQPFQVSASTLPSRALLLAPCGVGKTLAGWRWTAAQLDHHSARRVIFLYPTRGTAAEGFRDYVSHAPEADAALLSATAAYELEGMFDNPADARGERSFETDGRLFAVGAWRKRLISATVDQFLGFMQQVYKSACLLPMLADSVVVIDEVHSFDAALFATLIRFLETFDIPVLCMTASLPAARRQQLQALGLAVYPREPADFAELEARAEAPRYQVAAIADAATAQDIAVAAVHNGKRVLWVVNTVDRCQRLAQDLSALAPLCYHSRFKLEHRNARHREVVARFAPAALRDGGLIAVTTQVCEMSLDLDADVLITEQAPVTALIQRMGRCNRHGRPERELGQVYIYRPERERPYRPEDLATVEPFLAALNGRAVSQATLEALLDELSRLDPAERDTLCTFLDDGPWARGGAQELRDGDDFTVPAVLDSDIERWHPGADGLVLPVPRRPPLAEADPQRRLPRYLRVAPASHYSPALGFMTEPLTPPQDADS
jgi:CRISPR-associated endonuclease/helicase Cas3